MEVNQNIELAADDFENMIIELPALGKVLELSESQDGFFKCVLGEGFKNNYGSLQRVNEILKPAMDVYPYIEKAIFDEGTLEVVLRNFKKEKK